LAQTFLQILQVKAKQICNLSLTGENPGNIAYQNSLSRFKYLAINNATAGKGI
jgi:hypothetical protein